MVGDPRWSPDGAHLAWVRAHGDRADLVVTGAAESTPRVIAVDPAPVAARSTGGGVLAWAGGDHLLYVASEGRLGRVAVAAGGPAETVLQVDGRLAAPACSANGRFVAFVVDTEDSCAVMVAPVDGSAPPRPFSRADFAWDPTWSPAGQLAWHEWDFPDMSWDASRVMFADPEYGARTVAGGDGIAVGQPRFSARGELAYVSDEQGWSNVWVDMFDADGRRASHRPVLAEAREHAEPAWGPGQRSYAWSPDGAALAINRNEDGFGRLVIAPAGGGAARELSKGWHHGLDWAAPGIACIRSGARTPSALSVVVADANERRVVERGPDRQFDEVGLAEPEAVTWPGVDGATVHGLLWRAAGDAVRPPLLVDVHGGPTGQATVAWNPRPHFFTSRGWAVLQPNPRGSSGYGRAYLQALAGRWGELDVDDVAAGIRAATARGWGDPSRVVVAGGSAGGFIALLVCIHHAELVRAAVVQYPVADLVELAATTHRFESHYSDRLIGELPRDEAVYRARSPLTYAERIRTPLLVLQGDADLVVSPAQVDRLVDEVRSAGGSVEYHRYAGEGHGWSRPETVADSLRRVAEFLAQVAAFTR